jgi:hypothetical protein
MSTEAFKVIKYLEYSPTNILHFLSIRYASFTISDHPNNNTPGQYELYNYPIMYFCPI